MVLFWKFCIFVLLLCVSPLIWLWLIIDYPNLKRVALDIEPENIPVPFLMTTGIIDTAVREILSFVLLPVIALIGIFMCVLARDSWGEVEAYFGFRRSFPSRSRTPRTRKRLNGRTGESMETLRR